MSPLAARLDALASDLYRLARASLGPSGLAALREGSAAGATIDMQAIGMMRAADLVTEGLRQFGASKGLDPAEVALIGADHYGRRPAAPAQEVSGAR